MLTGMVENDKKKGNDSKGHIAWCTWNRFGMVERLDSESLRLVDNAIEDNFLRYNFIVGLVSRVEGF